MFELILQDQHHKITLYIMSYFTGDRGEYFNVALIDGTVDLSVNLGSGKYDANINIPDQRFDDNKWHHVVVTRESREVSCCYTALFLLMCIKSQFLQ